MTLVVEYLGWVDLDLGSSHGWWAATLATYCPSRMVEHPKSKSAQPRYSTPAYMVHGYKVFWHTRSILERSQSVLAILPYNPLIR